MGFPLLPEHDHELRDLKKHTFIVLLEVRRLEWPPRPSALWSSWKGLMALLFAALQAACDAQLQPHLIPITAFLIPAPLLALAPLPLLRDYFGSTIA